MAELTRTLRLGHVGADVFAAKRMVARYLRDGPVRDSPSARRFGPYFAIRVNTIRRRENMKPTGVFDQPLLDTMRDGGFVDAYSDSLLAAYAKANPPKPKLVEPNQGWGSLHRSLWEPYSIGVVRYGLRDGPGLASGTYNPSSRLPGGGPSDHSVYPAMAFDLDIGPDTGWQNEKARAFFMEMIQHAAVEYVILGDRIWAHPRRAEGIRRYTAGGHANHIHVSGFR